MGVTVEARDVYFQWPASGALALNGVTLNLGPGELVAIVGPNGAGKSTLLRILSGFLRPTRGGVFVDGVALNKLKRRDAARRFAFVPQYSEVNLPYTVGEMVAFARYPHLGPFRPAGREDRAAVARALAATDVAPLAHRPMSQLSGGEFQRVVLARALAQEPAVVFVDEPTAHLDLAHEGRILGLLRRFNRDEGMAVVAVMHDLAAAATYFPRVVLLAAGRVVGDGAPAEVLTPGNVAAAYGVAVEVAEFRGRRFVIPVIES